MLSPVWRKQSHQQWSQVHRVDRFQSTEDRKGNFLVRGELQLRDSEAQSGHLDGFICWPKDTCTLQRWVCLGVLIIGCDIIAKNWRGSVALNTNDSFHFLKVKGMQTGTQVSPNDQPRGTDTKCKAPDTLSLCSVGTAQQLSSLTFSRGGLVTRDPEPKEPSRSTGCWDLLPDVLSREFLEKIEVTKWDEEKETVNWLRRGKHCENPSVLGSPS